MAGVITGVANPRGGVMPGQQQYAQFLGHEQDVHNAAAFGSHGMGHSTGITQMDAGANFGIAQLLQQLSQQDANAAQNYLNQVKGAGSQTIGNLGSVLGGGSSSGG